MYPFSIEVITFTVYSLNKRTLSVIVDKAIIDPILQNRENETILHCQNLQRTKKKSTNLNNVHCALEKRFLRNGLQQSISAQPSNVLFFDVINKSFPHSLKK